MDLTELSRSAVATQSHIDACHGLISELEEALNRVEAIFPSDAPEEVLVTARRV